MRGKIILFSIICWFCFINVIAAQSSCYKQNRAYGIAFQQLGQFEKAISYLNKAKSCPDKPHDNDLDELIRNCSPHSNEAVKPKTEKNSHTKTSTLTVNGMETSTSVSFTSEGGEELLSLSGNSDSITVMDLPYWCHIINSDHSNLVVRCEENKSIIAREDWFKIESKDGEVKVYITQHGYPQLEINGRIELISVLPAHTGAINYSINTITASDYDIPTIPAWCTIDYQAGERFQIRYEANDSSEIREGEIIVISNNQQVSIKLQQLAERQQVNQVDSLVNIVPLRQMGNDSIESNYTGEQLSGIPNGLGFSINEKDIYYGTFVDGKRNGIGIVIIKDPENIYQGNCPLCVYYVGEWTSNKRNGQGTCYDTDGNIIYQGRFIDDHPIMEYPSDTEKEESRKFGYIKYPSGNYYYGETLDGKRSGKGVFYWATGNSWYGTWDNGVRTGEGIYILADGTFETGVWEDDMKIN